MTPEPRVTIHRFLKLLFDAEEVFEVRAPKAKQRANASYTSTVSGYFTGASIERAEEEIALLDEAGLAPGIYVTLNPVSPDLLARAANRLVQRAAVTTTDTEVVRRRWLLIDVDPVRPAGVSATDAELAAALERAAGIRDSLGAAGWPVPIEVESGNGAHLLYRVDLPRDDGSLLQRVLAALADHFDDDVVSVDRSVFNPARIVKVAGTTARKGDDLRGIAGVADRPHRRARLTAVPDEIAVVPVKLLEALAGPRATTSVAAPQSVWRDADRFPTTPDGVRSWLEAHGVAVKAQRLNGTKTMLLLECCPVNPEIVSTGGSDIAVLVGDDGKLAYCNKHNRGRDFTWHDLRRAIDPGYDGPAPGSADDLGGVDLSGFMVGAASSASVSSVSAPEQAGSILPDLRTVRQLTTEYPRLRPPVIHGLLREGETMNVIASVSARRTTSPQCSAPAQGRLAEDRAEIQRGRVTANARRRAAAAATLRTAAFPLSSFHRSGRRSARSCSGVSFTRARTSASQIAGFSILHAFADSTIVYSVAAARPPSGLPANR